MGRGVTINWKRLTLLLVGLSLFLLYYLWLPKTLFDKPYAALVFDENGEVLGARIAKDYQWRFSPQDSLPSKFEICLINFEDQHFNYHPGFNFIALVKAFHENVKAGKVVSGGSTLSMQLVRLSRDNPSRTIPQKMSEVLMATRIEWSFSKQEILNLYAAHAPFGGNTVGLEAAAWRYFGRSPWDLSWAESATLAVLPNAPGLIHPGRNRNALKTKRDGLLLKLRERGQLTEEQYTLALIEGLPEKPIPLRNISPHLVESLNSGARGKSIKTTLNLDLQRSAIRSMENFQEGLNANEVYNAGLLLLDANTGAVKAYVGNYTGKNVPDRYNDMLRTPRSSGSILKPFLYCSMLNEGSLWPKELVRDIPLLFADFKPENFVNSYSGAIPADDALAQSLNIPFVYMLKSYGVDHFLSDLKEWDFSTVNRSASNYGLSLILGGAEVNAWDLGNAYFQLQQKLKVTGGDRTEISNRIFLEERKKRIGDLPDFSPGAAHHTLKAMRNVIRPNTEMGWQFFNKGSVAWKTGTSFGHRDAWAVGITPDYIAVVWVGNSTGEGRPGLVGASSAGPILFNLLNKLPEESGFTTPHDDLKEAVVCRKSGYPSGKYCDEVDTILVPNIASTKKPCSFHQRIFTSLNEEYRVNRTCANENGIKAKNVFVLPSTMAWYYKKQHTSYTYLPSWHPDCNGNNEQIMELVYPKRGAQIFLPKDLGSIKQEVIMEISHQKPELKVFWHLNGKFVASTQDFHQLRMDLEKGEYKLHIEDENGNSVKGNFSVSPF